MPEQAEFARAVGGFERPGHDVESTAAGHRPACERKAVEERGEARLGGRGGNVGHELARESTHERYAGKHRIRRADRGEDCGPGGVGVGNVMKAPVDVGHGRIGIGAHPERAGLVMRRAEGVGAIFEHDHRAAIGESRGHVLRRPLHRGQHGLILAVVHGDRDERARRSELIGLRVEAHEAVRILWLHFADAADRHDHEIVVRIGERAERVHVGDFPKQLRLRIGRGARSVETGRGDLEMEMAERIVGVFDAPFEENRSSLEILHRRSDAERAARDADREVRPQMRHEIRADVRTVEGVLRQPRALDRALREDDDRADRHGDEAEVRLDSGDDELAGLQAGDVAVRHHHQPLLHVVASRLSGRGARRLHEQRHGAEFVDRKSAGARAALHRERRFELVDVLLPDGDAVEMQRQFRQRDRVGDGAARDRIEEPLAQRELQLADDKVVRFGDADLLARLAEIARLQFRLHRCRPHAGRHLRIKQLRRPPAPEKGAPAHAIGEAGKLCRRMPGEPPEFLAPLTQRGLIVRGLPSLDLREEDLVRDAEPWHRDILHMLGQRKRPRFEHEDAMLIRLVALEDRGRQRAAKCAAADDDDIERTGVGALSLVDAVQRFIKAVAYETTDDIARKGGFLGISWRVHISFGLFAISWESVCPACTPKQRITIKPIAMTNSNLSQLKRERIRVEFLGAEE